MKPMMQAQARTAWLFAAIVSFVTLSPPLYAGEGINEKYYDDVVCNNRNNLLRLHPGNTEDWLKHMNPGRPNGLLTSGDSILHRLARDDKSGADIVRSLLEAGGDPNRVNDHGISALMVAATYGRTDIVKLLLEFGADPNFTSELPYYPCKTTALHWAGYLGHTDVIAVLVDAGADPNAAATSGATPIDWVNLNGNVEALLAMLGSRKGPEAPGESAPEAPGE